MSARPATDPFPTTRWTELFALRDLGPEGARLAFGRLYERYWIPLYGFLRRRGHAPDDAADLLQEFFAHLLDRDFLSRLELTGRLRAFLLASLKNFMRDERDRRRAAKRQPGLPLVSLDVEAAERAYLEVPSGEASPEEIYERRWAEGMIERATARLEETERRAGRDRDFALLRAHVLGDDEGVPYRRIAEDLGVSESAIKVRVHRLRKRFGRFLREDIELTVDDEAAVDDELRHLLAAVA